MEKIHARLTKKTDWVLIASVGLLVSIGVVILFAIEEGAANQVNFSPYKHLLHLGVGIILAFFVARSNFNIWFKLSSWLYWLSIILLFIVLFHNPTAGSSRWIELGFAQFQPSELAKFALMMLLARLFSRRSGAMNNPWNIVLSIVYTAVPAGLTLLQPDLGTAIVFVVIWLSMIMISDIKPRFLLLGFGVIFLAIIVSVPFLADYQRQRIMTFLDPAADPQGAGYNVRQASIAIGSGQIFGQGLDSGSQSQLAFLPAQHTDFIFAVTAEKLGFVGALTAIVAFAIVVIRALVTAVKLKNPFAAHMALGIAVLIGFHAIINIGMNIGLVPVTGLPLTFVSYGGTHLIIMLIAIGVLISVRRTRTSLEFQ